MVTVHMERPLDEPVSGLIEIHGTVQGRGQILCNNYIPFPPEMSENFGKYIWSAILITCQVKHDILHYLIMLGTQTALLSKNICDHKLSNNYCI